MKKSLLAFTITSFILFILTECNKKKAVLIGQTFQVKMKAKEDSSTLYKTNAQDTIPSVLNENYSLQVDSFIKNNRLSFSTFSSDLKIDYSDNNNQSFDINAYIRIKKDSIIWVSMEVFGLEIFRIKIIKNEISILNKFANQYETMPLVALEKMLGFPVDYHLLEDVLIGNPIQLSDSNTISKQAEYMQYSNQNKVLKNVVNYLINKKQISVISLETLQSRLPTVCTIYHSNFLNMENNPDFALSRSIVIKGKVQSMINLYFKKIKVNIEQSYPFNIPKHYTISK